MEIYINRIKKSQRSMKNLGIDYLLIGPSSNMFYLTGKKTVVDERLQLMIVPVDDRPFLVLPEMYREKFKAFEDLYELRYWKDTENPYKIVKSMVVKSANIVAVDEQLWTGHFILIMNIYSKAKYIGASKILGPLKIVKDEAEIGLMLQSGRIIDGVMERAIHKIEPGMTEIKLAHWVEAQIKEAGAEDIAFKPIIASGPNCAIPHHTPSDRQLQIGEFVLLDFGAVYGGYCSDMTRTFFLGKANSQEKEVYNIVKQAYIVGYCGAVKEFKCENLDAAVRKVISAAGYGKYFIHRTGHGIGIDIHEDPYIAKGNTSTLENGMVFSVEPGIYLPGKFGVRLENIVVVNDEKPVELNNTTMDLIEI